MNVITLTVIFGIPFAVFLAYAVVRRGKHNTAKMDAEGVPPIATIVEPDIKKADAAISKGWGLLRAQPAGAYAEVKVKTGEENHTLRVWKAK